MYRGPETRYNFENVEPSVEYTFRVCPVRIMDSGDLLGTYSTAVRHVHVMRTPETNVTNSLSVQNRTTNLEQIDSSPILIRNVSLFRQIINRFTSILSNRNQLNDQEKAVVVVVVFMVITTGFAAIIKKWFR